MKLRLWTKSLPVENQLTHFGHLEHRHLLFQRCPCLDQSTRRLVENCSNWNEHFRIKEKMEKNRNRDTFVLSFSVPDRRKKSSEPTTTTTTKKSEKPIMPAIMQKLRTTPDRHWHSGPIQQRIISFATLSLNFDTFTVKLYSHIKMCVQNILNMKPGLTNLLVEGRYRYPQADFFYNNHCMLA